MIAAFLKLTPTEILAIIEMFKKEKSLRKKALIDKQLRLTDIDYLILRKLRKILERLQMATQILQTDKISKIF
jgi:hypothetical protein